ncbi:glycoside hydrolase TIM-barrel-like domain-containing protein [Terricaulis sp.]|uniref:baseplate multidomain protein megatron n=1 Tax=Terricaulis sp. TaxID=2768686 RepID=UPI003784BB4A
MAEIVLSTVGKAIGTRFFPAAFQRVGAALLQSAGAALGRAIDQSLLGGGVSREGPRLTDLHLQGSSEGASIPAVYGSVRIAGQVIWAARFKEHVEKHESGGKGGPRIKSTDYRYTLSFAVGLCEGEVARIGRVWANGEPFDLSQAAWRLHTGGETQEPDPLIETIEGAEAAPAYRGLAYIVFEDLPLEAFGNAIPQLSFEIVRPAPVRDDSVRFEDRVKGVCLIPASGEFVYATEPVLRRSGPGQETAENVHVERDRANLLVSLDQLAADFPQVETVLLVVAWFGDDLRCGHCTIRPGVERADKTTSPLTWRAGDVSRASAHVVSQIDGAPAFGGTPSDQTVVQALHQLKARGYKVGLYPFVLMDVPVGNALPDPYGGAEQAAYPWRGRITLNAPESDQTSAAADQVRAFFGAAEPGDFTESGGVPNYTGPDEFSYRRFALHYAKLATLIEGGVDVFVLGSELRGLTAIRDSATTFPAVDALCVLATDVRAMLDTVPRDQRTVLAYAADWSEYAGHQPQDGSGDLFFHLDPLWAHDAVDVVGVDWYPPLSDWRAGDTHADAALARSIHDVDYLESRVEAGENYDWFYATDADRAEQLRTPITDEDYAEPWIFRAKDLRNFWARAHYNRPGGVRSPAPTAWAPQAKPIWFIELGCPAVDKGANAPNLFVDDKSAESALPPFSSGARDDLIQRRTLEAYLKHWDGAANPVSSADGRSMIGAAFLWCWDARPYPAFPGRTDVWSDGGSWRLGHWLNGRAGLSGLGEVVRDLCARACADAVDVTSLLGAVSGYVVDAPSTVRAVIEPLMAAYDFVAAERDGLLSFFHAAQAPALELGAGDFTAELSELYATRGDAAERPVEARVRFLDPARDYLIADVSARRLDRADGGVISIEAPLALEVEAAEALAQMVLADRRADAEALSIGLGPAHLALEPGDRIANAGEVFEIARIEDAEQRRLELKRTRAPLAAQLHLTEPAPPPDLAVAPTPVLTLLDLPPLPGAESEGRPLVGVFASPWLGAHVVHAGSDATLLSQRARVVQPAIMGELIWALWPGPVDLWDTIAVLRVKLYGGALESATGGAVLDGANIFAIESHDGEWELVQARSCVLIEPDVYELSGFLRGQLGSAHAMRAPHPAGARIVKLDDKLVRADVWAHEWGEPLLFSAPPQAGAVGDPRAAHAAIALLRATARPWAPAHLRAAREAGGDVAIRWIRCARAGGDAWAPGEPPVGDPAESYLLEILDGGAAIRSVTTSSTVYVYPTAEQVADFGALPGSLQIRVAQMSASGVPGLKAALTIAL